MTAKIRNILPGLLAVVCGVLVVVVLGFYAWRNLTSFNMGIYVEPQIAQALKPEKTLANTSSLGRDVNMMILYANVPTANTAALLVATCSTSSLQKWTW
jgi:hypothetical protein